MVNLIVNWKTWEAPHSLVWCVKPLIIESEWFRNYQPPTRLVHHRKQSKLIKLSGIYSFALLYSLENFSRSMLISFPKCVPATQHYKLIKRAGPEQFLHKININSFHFNVFYARDFFTRNLHFFALLSLLLACNIIRQQSKKKRRLDELLFNLLQFSGSRSCSMVNVPVAIDSRLHDLSARSPYAIGAARHRIAT